MEIQLTAGQKAIMFWLLDEGTYICRSVYSTKLSLRTADGVTIQYMREKTFKRLHSEGLIKMEKGLYIVSEKGREFIKSVRDGTD